MSRLQQALPSGASLVTNASHSPLKYSSNAPGVEGYCQFLVLPTTTMAPVAWSTATSSPTSSIDAPMYVLHMSELPPELSLLTKQSCEPLCEVSYAPPVTGKYSDTVSPVTTGFSEASRSMPRM